MMSRAESILLKARRLLLDIGQDLAQLEELMIEAQKAVQEEEEDIERKVKD